MRALAQAGNRTSKTALCRQWWDSRLEWRADASGTGNQHHRQLFVSCTRPAQQCRGLRSQEPFLQQVRTTRETVLQAAAAARHVRPREVLGRVLFRFSGWQPKNLKTYLNLCCLCAWPWGLGGAKATVLSKKLQKKVCNATLCGATVPGRPAPKVSLIWAKTLQSNLPLACVLGSVARGVQKQPCFPKTCKKRFAMQPFVVQFCRAARHPWHPKGWSRGSKFVQQ